MKNDPMSDLPQHKWPIISDLYPDIVSAISENIAFGFDVFKYHEKALKAMRWIKRGLNRLNIVDEMFNAYTVSCGDVKPELKLVAREISEEDRKRLNFEALVFSVVLFLQYSNRNIFQDSTLKFRTFSYEVLLGLQDYYFKKKMYIIPDIVVKDVYPTIKLDHSKPLTVKTRVEEYYQAQTLEQILKKFTFHAAHAIDPWQYVIAEMVALSFIEVLQSIVDEVFNLIFKDNKWI